MAFDQRIIKATFVLGEGTFGETGSNQLDLPPLRTTADMIYAGGAAMGTLEMAIFGMTLSQMNQISTLGFVYTQQRRNSITVSAGDATAGMATVFQGTIRNAWPDLQGAPDVPFRVSAATLLLNAIAPATTISVNGSADAANLLSGIATLMGLRFENNGVSVKLTNGYYSGSARTQALAIVKDAGIEWNAGANGVLAIWPAGQSRSGAPVLVSKDTCMDGYPTYTSNGVLLRTLFNPNIGLGGSITITTDLKLPYAGNWSVYGLNHHLDSMVPKGRWFSDIQAAPFGSGVFTP
jgi:hypothetical protein